MLKLCAPLVKTKLSNKYKFAYLWLSIVLNKLFFVHFETHKSATNSPPTHENIWFLALRHLYID